MSATLESLLNTRAFRDHLDETVKEVVSDHYSNRLDELTIQQSDAALLHTYLSLANLFDAYPTLHKVLPAWTPVVDEDRNFLLKFRLHIAMEGDTDLIEYGYGDWPGEFGDCTAFDKAIEAGEYLGPETWNHVTGMVLDTRDEPFTSKEEVLAEMNRELDHFLPMVKAWALDMGLEDRPDRPQKPKSKM